LPLARGSARPPHESEGTSVAWDKARSCSAVEPKGWTFSDGIAADHSAQGSGGTHCARPEAVRGDERIAASRFALTHLWEEKDQTELRQARNSTSLAAFALR
jgi:hypothetical protein